MTAWQNRLYLGTWQLGGNFTSWLPVQTCALVAKAWELGIRRFDTAAVYGNGRVEEVLGSLLPEEAVILTKIPAQTKPDPVLHPQASSLYSEQWLNEQLAACQSRLRRQKVGAVLLHNWLSSWNSQEDLEPLTILAGYKRAGLVDAIGISLPDGFGSVPVPAVLNCVDVLEAPVNIREQWLLPHLQYLRERGIEVIIRSIFLQGMLLKDQSLRDQLELSDIRRRRYADVQLPEPRPASDLLREAWERQTSVVVGMTTAVHLRENIATVQCED